MNSACSTDLKSASDDDLLALLATLDRRKQARLIQQIRSELGVRGVYFIERVVTEQGKSRVEICRREAVIPSQGLLLSGAPPIDWEAVRGQRLFVFSFIFAVLSYFLPNLGVMPVFSVSETFLMLFYSSAALFTLILVMLARRDLQTAVPKWRFEQLLLIVNAGLLALTLQNPLMLSVHYLTAKSWHQQVQVFDLQRNNNWCKRSVFVKLTRPPQAPSNQTPNNSTLSLNPAPQSMRLCGFAMTDYDLLRPNDHLELQGRRSVAAITVTEVLIVNATQQMTK